MVTDTTYKLYLNGWFKHYLQMVWQGGGLSELILGKY